MAFPTALTGKALQSSSLKKDEHVVITRLGDGKTQRAGIGFQSKFDVWTLNFDLDPTDYATFKTFYTQHGLVKAFEWTSPLGDTANYIFDSAPQIQFDGFRQYKVTFSLREVQESLL